MTGYSQSPRLLKGALIKFDSPLLIPIPNIIVFQYNPETLTRELRPWQPPEGEDSGGVAQPYDPAETFSLTLELDAADELEVGDPITVLTGVADRIAAFEMMLYPEGGGAGLLTPPSISLSGGLSISFETDVVPRTTVPVVLFFWGLGRVLPVRLTSFSVEEQAFSPTLYPLRAKVTVGLSVVNPSVYQQQDREPNVAEQIAIAAYQYTMVQKQVLATLNLANSIDSILGMLPF